MLTLETMKRRRKLYLSGLTLPQVAELEGVSYQAVDMSLRRFYPKLKRRSKSAYKLPRFKVPCVTCGKGIRTTINHKRTYCSHRCRARGRSPKPEHIKYGTRAYKLWRIDHRKYTARIRARMHYHNTYKHRPDWKELTSQRNLRNKERIKAKAHAENT